MRRLMTQEPSEISELNQCFVQRYDLTRTLEEGLNLTATDRPAVFEAIADALKNERQLEVSFRLAPCPPYDLQSATDTLEVT